MSKKYPGQRQVGLLFTAGQKYARVRVHHYFESFKFCLMIFLKKTFESSITECASQCLFINGCSVFKFDEFSKSCTLGNTTGLDKNIAGVLDYNVVEIHVNLAGNYLKWSSKLPLMTEVGCKAYDYV